MMRKAHIPGVVVIGGHVNGLGLVRSLASRGVRCAVLTTRAHDLAQYSNAVCDWLDGRALADTPEALPALLARRASEWAGWALLPSNDEALAAIEAHRDWLDSRHPVHAPAPGIVPLLLDKHAMRRLVAAAGIPHPAHYGEANARVVERADLTYPVTVKPQDPRLAQRAFGRKLVVARARDELLAAIARASQAGVACDVDAWIDGGDDRLVSCAMYFARDGAVSAPVLKRKLRQGPPSAGVACVAELATSDTVNAQEAAMLRDAMVALLAPLGFTGIAVAEFKRDPYDGMFKFIEVNGRSELANTLFRRGGFDMAAVAVEELQTGRAPLVTPVPWPGVWVNVHADLRYAITARAQDPMSFARFVAPYRRPLETAVWSRRDPRPYAAQWRQMAAAAAHALLGNR